MDLGIDDYSFDLVFFDKHEKRLKHPDGFDFLDSGFVIFEEIELFL